MEVGLGQRWGTCLEPQANDFDLMIHLIYHDDDDDDGDGDGDGDDGDGDDDDDAADGGGGGGDGGAGGGGGGEGDDSVKEVNSSNVSSLPAGNCC